MSIVEFIEKCSDFKLFPWQKQYISKLYYMYKEDPKDFLHRFYYPCQRENAKFNAALIFAVLFSMYDHENNSTTYTS